MKDDMKDDMKGCKKECKKGYKKELADIQNSILKILAEDNKTTIPDFAIWRSKLEIA